MFRTYITGRQALAEAVAEEFHLVVGPITDHLMRLRPVGWYPPEGGRALCDGNIALSSRLYAGNPVVSGDTHVEDDTVKILPVRTISREVPVTPQRLHADLPLAA